MNGITKETFLNAEDPKNRDAMLYDMLDGINNKISTCQSSMEPRIKKIEKRKRIDTVVGTVSGFAGGVSAVVGKWFFFRGS